jgi:hypothetical protein
MIINNIDDLRAEIALLKVQKTEQELAIKEHFSSPSAIFNTVFSGLTTPAVKKALFDPEDLIALVSRLFLPFALNKTLFRNSNFLIKILVGLVSQQASGLINNKTVSSVWDTIKSLIDKVKKKKPANEHTPQYSDSY